MPTTRWKFRKLLLIGFCVSGLILLLVAGLSVAAFTPQSEALTIATTDHPVLLEKIQTRVVLKPGAREASKARSLASHLNALAPGRRIYLVLRDLRATDQPGVVYRLYLDLPADQKTTQASARHVVGTFNFFNADAADGFQSPGDHQQRFFSYDVTDLVRTLQKQNRLRKETTVTIISAGTPATRAKASIGRIELVEQ